VAAHEDETVALLEPPYDVPNLGHPPGVEPGGRFVEDHDGRVMDQGRGNVDALLHPLRETAHFLIGPVPHLHLFEHGGDAVAALRNGHAAQVRHHLEGLVRSEGSVDLGALDEDPDVGEGPLPSLPDG
jgi:hypothetical protein